MRQAPPRGTSRLGQRPTPNRTRTATKPTTSLRPRQPKPNRNTHNFSATVACGMDPTLPWLAADKAEPTQAGTVAGG